MENRHLITKQVFELRVGFNEAQVPQLQNAFSQHYWHTLVPAFEKLFDRLVGPDEIVRIDRLELDIGRWSADDVISGRFAGELVLHLESAVAEALRGAGVTLDRLPLCMGNFRLWLHFLEYGYLPVAAVPPESQQVWQQQILESLNSTGDAKHNLRYLALRRPLVLERLIYQHDSGFLQKLLEALGGQSQSDLLRLVEETVDNIINIVADLTECLIPKKVAPAELENIATALSEFLVDLLEVPVTNSLREKLRQRILEGLDRHFSSPQTLAQGLLQADTWEAMLDGFVHTDTGDALAKQISGTLQASARLHRFATNASPESPPPEIESNHRKELACGLETC